MKRAVEHGDFPENVFGLYVSGPVGIGKSFLLYLLATEFRTMRSKYRVTYINDCLKWIQSPYNFLLRELIVTFSEDIINGSSIIDLCKIVMNGFYR